MKRILIKAIIFNICLLLVVGCSKKEAENITTTEELNNMNIYIVKLEKYDTLMFKEYYKVYNEDRHIYLAGNISEIYLNDMTLEKHITSVLSNFDDAIENITDNLELVSTLKDGGSKVYRSFEKDITLVVCNTTKGDKDIYIGDYSLDYSSGVCNN